MREDRRDEGQDEGQRLVVRKVEDGRTLVFSENAWGPSGCRSASFSANIVISLKKG